MQTNIIGIDPGLHGGIAILVFDGDPNIPIHIHDMPDTYPDMFNLLSDIKAMFWPVSCILETDTLRWPCMPLKSPLRK